jgi:ATP-binding cassette, subfamily F, member 3
MALLSIQNLSTIVGHHKLFEGLNLTIDRGDRIGFIGRNGAGKSTLLKMILGEMKADEGTIGIARGTRIGILRQDPHFTPGNTVADEAELAFAELHAIDHELRKLEHDMAEQGGDDLQKTMERYTEVSENFERMGGWAWRHRVEATLLGVGLGPEHWDTLVDRLSGGQRSRLALAKLLIEAPDLLLLDEPTNHLDMAAVEWLETYLARLDAAVLIISHDRFLLDKTVNRIVHLDQRKLFSYPGNYSEFVIQKERNELSQQRAFEKQQAHIQKQEEFIRRFNAGQRAKEAQGREKILNRLKESDEMVARVTKDKQINLQIGTERRAGDRVLTVKELGKSFGEKQIWKDAKFDLARGDRVGVIGPNGSGKTTLLRTLTGEMPADKGDIRWGSNLEIGYYDQRLDDFKPTNTVLEEATLNGKWKEPIVRDALGAMGITGDDSLKRMSDLSGGERARVALVKLLLEKPNVLLLDEPTNHLDILSCEALEDALVDYPGTIICVSHDRYFLDRITSRLLIIDPPAIEDFDGGFHAWTEKQNRKAAEATPAKKPEQKKKDEPRSAAVAPAARPTEKKKDNPYTRPFGKLDLKALEKQIADTETEIARVSTDLAKAKAGNAKQLSQQLKTAQGKLEQLEAEYMLRGDA